MCVRVSAAVSLRSHAANRMADCWFITGSDSPGSHHNLSASWMSCCNMPVSLRWTRSSPLGGHFVCHLSVITNSLRPLNYEVKYVCLDKLPETLNGTNIKNVCCSECAALYFMWKNWNGYVWKGCGKVWRLTSIEPKGFFNNLRHFRFWKL